MGIISKYRSELMGIAIIMVMLFHISLPQTDMFYGLKRLGNVGVDVFLLLSGIGLWFAWAKMKHEHFVQDVLGFYRRRLLRIYPTWLIVALLFYVPRFIEARPPFDHRVGDWQFLLCEIGFNVDFWIHTELKFWYLPAILVLYLFAPFYLEMIRRWPQMRWTVLLSVVWCFAVQYVEPINAAVGHVEIFWSRVPIFLLGMNLGEMVRTSQYDFNEHPRSRTAVVLTFLLFTAVCYALEQFWHGEFPIFYERMLYIILALSLSITFAIVLRNASNYVLKAATFLGTISFEIYLIHCQFVYFPVIEDLELPYWVSFILTLAISLPLAWALAFCAKKINKVMECALK